MLVFKLEMVKHIFENEKLNLNLNSMRLKKDKVQKIILNIYDSALRSFTCVIALKSGGGSAQFPAPPCIRP